jgi:hypothetical protein
LALSESTGIDYKLVRFPGSLIFQIPYKQEFDVTNKIDVVEVKPVGEVWNVMVLVGDVKNVGENCTVEQEESFDSYADALEFAKEHIEKNPNDQCQIFKLHTVIDGKVNVIVRKA